MKIDNTILLLGTYEDEPHNMCAKYWYDVVISIRELFFVYVIWEVFL